MEISKEEFFKRMHAQGFDDDDMIESFYKSSTRGAPKKKRKGNPMAGQERPKKYIGRFEFTEVCQTCGSRTTKKMIMEIDPNKPKEDEVPVNVCNACIPRYEAMDKEQLISLIILKDHPDIGFRMLSNKQQIKLAKISKPRELLNKRLEIAPAPDKRHLRPQYDEPQIDRKLLIECQLIYNRAYAEHGPDLGGKDLLDLLTDETGESLTDIRRIAKHIKKR